MPGNQDSGMRKTIILIFAVLISGITPLAGASEQCDGDTCIDVSADEGSNQVVITVKKGKAGSSQNQPGSTTKPTQSTTTRKLWIPWLPKPSRNYATSKPRPRPVITVRPKAKKISGSQLSNRVKRLLPSGSIITQPLGNPLVQEPVNFMTNTPQFFTTVIVVLNVPITIYLTPVFTWEFGDGNTQVTKLSGAPYPVSIIQNTYKNSGKVQVTLTTKWTGFWQAGALRAPINGGITQKTYKELLIRPAGVNYQP